MHGEQAFAIVADSGVWPLRCAGERELRGHHQPRLPRSCITCATGGASWSAMASASGLGGAHAYRIAPMTQPPAPAITMPAMTFLAAGVPGSGVWKAQMPMLALTSKLS